VRHRSAVIVSLLLVAAFCVPAILAQPRPGAGRGPGDDGPPPPEMGGPPPPGERGLMPPPRPDFPPPDWTPEPELLAAIQKEDPEFWSEASRWKTSSPERFRVEVFRWAGRQERLKALRAQDPEKAKRVERIDALERQTRKLADQIRSAPESGRGPMKEKLMTLLSELFDRREEDRKEEIARLEKRIGDIKANVQDRRAHKDDILKQRANELLNGDEALRW
jgi:hypothetical protein